MVAALDEEMTAHKSQIYLIEGFPKNKENIETWNKKLSHKYHLKRVFYFHCSMTTLEKRLAQRGQKTGRKDDSPELIKKRLELYKTQTRPVVDYYQKSDRMVHINSERKVEAVFKQICAYIDHLIYHKEVRLPEVIFFSGGVGSGQGTQMNKICSKYGFKGIDTSALIRKASESDQEIKA